MSICSKIKKNIIEKPLLFIDDFKNSFLKNNYDENMFNNDGSLNPKYNSKKKTGIIAQIFEDHWDNIPLESKQNILNIKPNADKEINKIIACHNKNLGCSVYFCEKCEEYTFIGHTCKSRFCTSCGYKYKLSRVENIVQTAYNCKHRHIVFTCAKELWPYFFVNFDKMINIYFEAVNLTINSIFNESYKKVKGKLKKYVSLASITTCWVAVILSWTWSILILTNVIQGEACYIIGYGPGVDLGYVSSICVTLSAALLTIKHRGNIQRLKSGTERKITWMK